MIADTSEVVSVDRRALGMRICWVLLGLLAIALSLYWVKFAYQAYLAACFPGEIDYGEGVVWQQAKLIPSPRMYGDLQTYPFLVFHYPPVYHLIVHGFALLGVPWLMAGRLVSIASTVALAMIAAVIVYEACSENKISEKGRRASALIAGLLLITLWPIQEWSDVMRVDLLAVALEFLGMYLGLCSLRRPRLIYVAALVFVLAAYTKQTMLAGALATAMVLLMRNPAHTLRALIFAVVLGGAVFLLLTVFTHGGFIQHVVTYNLNPFSLQKLYRNFMDFQLLRTYQIYMFLALGAAGVLGLRFLSKNPRVAPVGHVVIFLYFLLTTASLVSLGKSGAASNYLIPWVGSWALLIGLIVAEALEWADRGGRPLILIVLLSALVVQAIRSPKLDQVGHLADPAYRRDYMQAISLVSKTAKPVFSEDMVLLMQAGKNIPWEPAIITELTRTGVFDEHKVIGMIDEHDFAYIVLDQNSVEYRFSPAVKAAILKEYRLERVLARMSVLVPARSGL